METRSREQDRDPLLLRHRVPVAGALILIALIAVGNLQPPDAGIVCLLGYGFSILIGHLFVSPFVNQLWRWIEEDANSPAVDGSTEENGASVQGTAATRSPDAWRPKGVGVLERLLITSAVGLGHSSFIAVWLALKAAASWSQWKQPPVFHVFLIGNGLSIAFAVGGAVIAFPKRLSVPGLPLNSPNAWLVPVAAATLLPAFTLIFYGWMKRNWRAQHAAAEAGERLKRY